MQEEHGFDKQQEINDKLCAQDDDFVSVVNANEPLQRWHVVWKVSGREQCASRRRYYYVVGSYSRLILVDFSCLADQDGWREEKRERRKEGRLLGRAVGAYHGHGGERERKREASLSYSSYPRRSQSLMVWRTHVRGQEAIG
jgi:hypothetical protein